MARYRVPAPAGIHFRPPRGFNALRAPDDGQLMEKVMALQGMERHDLPIVIVQLCFGSNRQYLGRVATKAEFEAYRENCGFPPEDITSEVWHNIFEMPCADQGLVSYRCKSQYGWVMIGATDAEDALVQAKRSTSSAKAEDLQVWDGTQYVPVATPKATSHG